MTGRKDKKANKKRKQMKRETNKDADFHLSSTVTLTDRLKEQGDEE